MAYDSKYYYEKYKTRKSDAKRYDGDIKDLNKIRDSLSNEMYDEIRAVNNEIDALVSDLSDSVRYNSVFTRETNNFGSEKEKTVTADGNLAGCIWELDEEISRLNTKYNDAVYYRDYYKGKCKEKLQEEGKPSWYYFF